MNKQQNIFNCVEEDKQKQNEKKREKEDRGPKGDVGIEGNSGSDGKGEWSEMVWACVEEG